MSDLRALMRECGLWSYFRLRKDGLIAYLWDSVRMETNYSTFRLVELRALKRVHELQEYYRLQKAKLIALLGSMPSTAPRDDEPTPMPLVSVNPRPRPPKSMRPSPPPPECPLTPYELKQALKRAYQSL